MKQLALLAAFTAIGVFMVAVPLSAQISQDSPTDRVMTDVTVMQLVKAGVATDLILSKIRECEPHFLLTPDALIQLKQYGVPDDLVRAMAAKQNGEPIPGLPPARASALGRPTPVAAVPPAPVAAVAPPPVAASGSAVNTPARIPIPSGITLCLQPMTGGFDGFLIGEMEKQQVPVAIIATVPDASDPTKPEVCDPGKSFYTMTGGVVPEGKTFSARSIVSLRVHYRDEVQAAVKLVRNSDNAVVWAGDSDRGEAKKVAEHIVNQMLKQRPSWIIPSPINR